MADQGLASLVQGLSQGISGYLGKQQDVQGQMAVKAAPGPAQPLDTDQDALITPDMAEKMGPGLGQLVTNYNQQSPNNPLKLKDAIAWAKQVGANADSLNPDSDKEQARQDKLENQYNTKLTQVRGDQSLMRTEAQRDAAGLAYDTIAKAQSENRDLSETEYSDVLGQLWKVRTGTSPTNEVLNDLRSKTAKEGLNRVITYASGNPNLVGATTTDTLNNIKQFVVSSGQKADQQWQAYMSPRMVPPTGLDPARAAHVSQTHRGISFADQMAVSNKTYPSKPQTTKIRVRRLSDGQTGTINSSDYDSSTYEKIGTP